MRKIGIKKVQFSTSGRHIHVQFWRNYLIQERRTNNKILQMNSSESLLTKLKSNQLADSFRTWYIFRAKAVKDLFFLDFDTEDFSSQEYLWFNRRVRCKSKQYFDYRDWYDKGIHTVADMLNVPDPDNVYIKTHEDLVSEFGISQKDKRKYNFLLKNIPSDWLDKPGFLNFNIYDRIIESLNLAGKISKIPKHIYSILLDKCYAEKAKVFCGNSFEDNELDNEGWEEIHLHNFKCYRVSPSILLFQDFS